MMLMLPFAASALTPTDVIDKAAKKLTSAGSVTAKFTGSASGTLIVSGDRFAMEAGGFGVWYNGQDMWTYSKKAGETSLTTPTRAELMESNPMAIIKGYKGQFNVAKVSQSGKLYTVKLTPKSRSSNIRTATVTINTSTWMPTAIDVIFTSNSRMTVNITSIKTGAAMAASAFAYPKSKYPGVEVVDLR